MIAGKIEPIMNTHYKEFRMEVLNSLAPELSAQCNVQNTGDLNGHTLTCIFLANDFRCIDYSQLLVLNS